MHPMDESIISAWTRRLHGSGLRLTAATRSVLVLFASDPGWGPSHAEVLERLHRDGASVNRVTLYRLLDKLAACGLLERHADATGRVWRFSWAGAQPPGGLQPRFECDACHRLVPLEPAQTQAHEMAQTLQNALAALGHHAQRLDLTIHGTCAGCASHHP